MAAHEDHRRAGRIGSCSGTARGRVARARLGAVMVVAASLLGAALAPAAAATKPRAAAPAGVAVIVQSPGAGAAGAEAAVVAAGGRVTKVIDLVDGVAATVAPAAVGGLARTAGLLVSPDLPVHVQGEVGTVAGTSVFRDVVGATQVNASGNRGEGVTVAVIDTGISEVGDLAGRIVAVKDDVKDVTTSCVNLSGEAGCGDSYGHGTFMAGIIAGSGAASGGRHAGVAPAARLLSIKVAGRDGSADVSTLLSALQWVVSFKDRYGIRVLNLSLGTDSTQSYRVDPLNYAVERAWNSGVAVIVAASNRGPKARTISKPGDDPWVITVGATDDRGTVELADDHIPDFTSRGPTAADGLAKPDVAAPGAHLVSLSAPGSAIAENFPTSIGGGYQVGNGTSMATAVVSGAAALLVKANPTITPDRMKFALMSTARPGPVPDKAAIGSGTISAPAAMVAKAGTANKGNALSTGNGSLDKSRGSTRVRTLGSMPTVVSGLLTQQLLVWDVLRFLWTVWGPTTWYASPSYLVSWQPVAWEGSTWEGSKWHGSKWHGGADTTTAYGRKWQGSDWYGAWD